MLGYVYGKYVWIIVSKDPGNDSDQFCSNEISVLLCEGPKHHKSMMSGFLTPGNPYLWILTYQIISNNIRNIMEPFSRILFL